MSASEGGILVVCAANVCRSPMAEFAMRRSFAERLDLGDVMVASAGVRVAEARPACEEVVAFQDQPTWRQMGSQHVARALEPEMVWEAGLVVAATRELRAVVVSQVPECRNAVFTLNEALWLGVDYARDTTEPAGDAVGSFRDYIHSMRGLRPLPAQRRRWLWSGVTENPLDIPDGHGGRGPAHRAAMQAAFAGGEELANLIAGRRS